MRSFCFQYVFNIVLGGLLWTTSLWAKSSPVKQAIMAFEKAALPEAKTYIDAAVGEVATQTQGDAWYYRGVIYEKLLRNQITTEEAPQLFEEALNAYRKAIALTSVASQYYSFAQINLNNLWMYYLDRGRRYYRQEAFESAIQQFACCKQIIPNNSYAHLYTAIAAHQDEKYDLALDNYTYYLTSGVEVPAAVYCGMAHLIAYSLKDPKQAIEIVEQALLQYPFDNDLLYEQIRLYTALGQVEDKKKLVPKQAESTAHEAATHYQLGYWYEHHGQWQEALVQYKKAFGLAPKSIEPICQQGIVHYNQAAQITYEVKEMTEEQFEKTGVQQCKQLDNHLSQALSCFKQANELNSRDAFVLKHLKIIYQYLHKPDQVKKIERRLLKYKL